MEYTIWLVPSGKLYDELAGIISRLSGEYTAPLFEPHLTLLGDIKETEEQVRAKTQELAGLVKPFSVFLTALDSFDEYFRSVFIVARQTEGLMHANAKAREVFGRQQDSPFFPHVSLLYGKFPPETKEQIMQSMGKEFARTFEAKSLHLIASGKDTPVKDWEALGEFPLQG